MPQDLKIVIDSACEFREMLWPWVVEEFWSLQDHSFRDGVVYIIDRQRVVESGDLIKRAIKEVQSRFVFSLPFEGSETLVNHIWHYRLKEEVLSSQFLLISGGDMPPEYPHLSYDLFLTKFHDFEENIRAANRSTEIFSKFDKPYKFLFLNGRERPHRKYLVEYFSTVGLLDQALWSYLSPVPAKNQYTTLVHDGRDLMSRPRSVKLLQPEYEVDRYRNNQITNFDKFVKSELFNNDWGDIYVNPDAYIDTYFSVVTETVFDRPYSFRTEKIAKPLGMAHPFIVAANRGYYRDLRNLGFKTFSNLIDESFDEIDCNQTRLSRLCTVIEDLCRQDLDSFITAARDICKYNQQQLMQVRQQVRQEFPKRFLQFLQKYE